MYFTKYEAAGNDFIVVDAQEDAGLVDFCMQHASQLCDRHFGIGADGILMITRTISGLEVSDIDAAMHVINSDGSIAAMCGNGIRCIARHLYESCGFPISRGLQIGTLGGVQTVKCLDGHGDPWQIEVALGVDV